VMVVDQSAQLREYQAATQRLGWRANGAGSDGVDGSSNPHPIAAPWCARAPGRRRAVPWGGPLSPHAASAGRENGT
jgi:hypothetical protein